MHTSTKENLHFAKGVIICCSLVFAFLAVAFLVDACRPSNCFGNGEARADCHVLASNLQMINRINCEKFGRSFKLKEVLAVWAKDERLFDRHSMESYSRYSFVGLQKEFHGSASEPVVAERTYFEQSTHLPQG